MDISAYIAFLTVVEEMNFTRAAKRLFITQQSLSGQIRRLEEHYHVRLFHRRPRLKLTLEGEAMTFYARQLLETEQAMTSRFADLTGKSAGILRIGFSHQRSSAFFPGIWSRYHAEFENISIRLHEKLSNQLLEDLLSGQLDMMIGVDIPSLADLTVIPLAQEQLRCIITESFLREYFPDQWQTMLKRFAQAGVELMELKGLPMILPSSTNRLRQPIDQLFRKHNAIPHIVLETASHSLLYQLGCQGSGVAVVNPLSLYEQISLRGLPPSYCHSFLIRDLPKRLISLAYRRDVELPLFAQRMIDAIVEEFDYYIKFLERFSL